MFKKLLVAVAVGAFSLATVQVVSAQVTGKIYVKNSATLGGYSFDCAGVGGCTIYQVDGLGTEIDFGNGESYLLFDDGTLEGAP